MPRPYAGVHSTALDTAVFGQMFLGGGTYGGVRMLSPATVAEMTRNQIPGIGAFYNSEYFPEASWGYGWEVRENKQALREGSLPSARAFLHGGGSGTYLWVDPVYELVGAYFSVKNYEGERVGSPLGCGDYFVNAVTAAVMDTLPR